jgi:hypothetical protein
MISGCQNINSGTIVDKWHNDEYVTEEGTINPEEWNIKIRRIKDGQPIERVVKINREAYYFYEVNDFIKFD